MTTTTHRSDRERGAQILNRNEQTRLNRVLDHLTLSKRLYIKSLEQQQHVFRVQSERRLKVNLDQNLGTPETYHSPHISHPPVVMVSPHRVSPAPSADDMEPDARMAKSILRLGHRRRDVAYFFHHDLQKAPQLPENRLSSDYDPSRRYLGERPRAETTTPCVRYGGVMEDDPVDAVANEQRSRSAPPLRLHSTQMPFFDRSLALVEVRQFLRQSARQRLNHKCPVQKPSLRDEAVYQRLRFNCMKPRMEQFYTEVDHHTKCGNQQSILISGLTEEQPEVSAQAT